MVNHLLTTLSPGEFCGAALSSCVNKWRNITSCETVLDWVKNGVPIPFVKIPLEPVRIQSYKQFSFEENDFIDKEVKKLCEQSCIVRCINKPKFISPLNVALKADNSYRLILDLREFNKLCKPKTVYLRRHKHCC